MSQTINNTARYIAMEALVSINRDQAYSNLEVDHLISEADLSVEDGHLATRLVYGVLQRQLTLDFYLSPFIKGKKMKNWVRQLLRLSVYQSVYLDRIPDHSMVDEAVKIAKHKGHRRVGNFVNAVLRNFLRQPLADLESVEDPIQRASFAYSMPEELLRDLINDYDQETAFAIAESVLEEPRASIRVNLKHLSRPEAKERLSEEGYECREGDLSPFALWSDQGNYAQSDLFKQGKITIQDESSMLVAEAMKLQPSHQVLDACAGPGGKTTHIANYLDADQGGHVLAADIHDHKLDLIQANVDRQGFSDLVTTRLMDASKAEEELESASFDRILVDAPCSGLGLMRRKPEIKYNKDRQTVENLQALQLEILQSVAPLLKQGGILVYSTCTISRAENEDVVAAFLDRQEDFQLLPIQLDQLERSEEDAEWIKLLPHHYHTDGFFICALQKCVKE